MRLKIWHKMIIGIAIPSFITLIGGLLTYGYINNVQKRQSYEQIADDINDHVLEVRRNEKNFFHFKNTEYLDNLHNAISVLDRSINNISAQAIEEIGKEDFALIQESIRKYPDLINKLYDNYRLETKVTERVRAEGRKLEAFVAGGNHATELTTSFILHLRLLEKNYMLFRDRKSFNRLNRELSQMKNITPFCYECTAYIEAIHDLFATYKKSESLVGEIQVAGNRLEEVTGRIAVNERQRIDAFIIKTKRLLFGALILLCTLGPFLVYKTAAYIVAPIHRLAEITKKIAEGDTTLRAPIREHDETYSLATSFNIMLDKLQLTYKSLEKSMELLKEKQAQLVDSEKRASLGLLVSGVAHELNNPLYNISLTVEAMREELNELTPEKILEYTEDILMQSKRAHNIIEDLLDFARARKSPVMEKQDVVRILNESINLVDNQLRINNIALQRHIPERPLFVKGNHSKLEQIFVSIFTNAIQAMKEKGILTVSIRPDTENKKIIIAISDTGPGIPEGDIKNVFEPFFTTKPVGEGTGLGLSVCHSLVEEHHGEIEVRSKAGEGTTFIIKFPQYENGNEESA